MVQTGFNEFACQTLRDLDRFDDATPFGYQTGYVRTGGNIPTFVQGLDLQSNAFF